MFVFALPLTAPPGHAQATASPTGPTASAVLHADQPGPVVNRNTYGHFAEHLGRGIYEGIWVGPNSPIPNTRGIRNDVLAALKELSIPVLRWPGGCFADEYHWKDGIGPLTVKLAGVAPKPVAGRVLTAPTMNAHNTFEAPNAVQPATFDGATVKGDTLEVRLPARSAVVLALR